MARIRTIKPSFFKNEILAELPFPARLLFIGLWTLADKEGRLEDRPKRIKAELFPYDNLDVDNLIERLQSAGFVKRYGVGDLKVIQILSFTIHQRITGSEADSKSELPEISKEQLQENPIGNTEETPRKQDGNTLETPRTTGKEGNGRERKGKDIVFPWDSENFKNFWQIWKDYKLEEHKFKFKSSKSEQASLKKLCEDSGGQENIAIKMIENAIANGWKGIYELKQDQKNGTSKAKSESATYNAAARAHQLYNEFNNSTNSGEH